MKIDVKTLTPMREVLSSVRGPVKIKLNGGDARRFVYWPDDPDGGCGVSYLDPVTNGGNWLDGWMRSECEERKEIVIAGDSESELGRRLMSIDILQDVEIEKRECYDLGGRPTTPIIYSLSRKSVRRNSFHPYYLKNDGTIRTFCFIYIKALLEHKDIISSMSDRYCFSDGGVVSREFGYDSVAYAASLYLSLARHNLIDAAMRSFESFLRYHPRDSITHKCDVELSRKSRDIYCDKCGKYDGCWYKGASVEDDDYLDTSYYVDESPVYDVSSQEEAEIEYWNTH